MYRDTAGADTTKSGLEHAAFELLCQELASSYDDIILVQICIDALSSGKNSVNFHLAPAHKQLKIVRDYWHTLKNLRKAFKKVEHE